MPEYVADGCGREMPGFSHPFFDAKFRKETWICDKKTKKEI